MIRMLGCAFSRRSTLGLRRSINVVIARSGDGLKPLSSWSRTNPICSNKTSTALTLLAGCFRRGRPLSSSSFSSSGSSAQRLTSRINLKRMVPLIPGVTLSLAVMKAGQMASMMTPIPMVPSSILVGVALGNILRNIAATSKLSELLVPGLKFVSATILRVGIVCVGLKLSAMDIAQVSTSVLPIVGICIASGITFVLALSSRLKLPRNFALLTAAGTSICGVTAISALAPAIRATQKEMALAVANVVVFGTFGMLVYPAVIRYVLDSSEQIGIFLGVAIHDTSQVMGAALSYSRLYDDDKVLELAAITKLTRNLCLAAVIPGLAFLGGKTAAASSAPLVPGFVLGFVGMAMLRSVGDAMLARDGDGGGGNMVDRSTWTWITSSIGGTASLYLLSTAMAGVGLSTNLASLRGVGLRPFIVGFAGSAVVGSVGLASVLISGAARPDRAAASNNPQ